MRFNESGQVDTAWHGGIFNYSPVKPQEPSDLSRITVMDRRLYAVWDNYLYLLATPNSAPAATGDPADPTTDPRSVPVFSIWAVFIWVISIGLIAALWLWIRKSTRQNRKK